MLGGSLRIQEQGSWSWARCGGCQFPANLLFSPESCIFKPQSHTPWELVRTEAKIIVLN